MTSSLRFVMDGILDKLISEINLEKDDDQIFNRLNREIEYKKDTVRIVSEKINQLGYVQDKSTVSDKQVIDGNLYQISVLEKHTEDVKMRKK